MSAYIRTPFKSGVTGVTRVTPEFIGFHARYTIAQLLLHPV